MRNHVQVPVVKQDLNTQLSGKESDALHSTEEQQEQKFNGKCGSGLSGLDGKGELDYFLHRGWRLGEPPVEA